MGCGGIEQTLPDIPRIYTALAEWLACMVCILEMHPRFEKWKICGILALALPVQAVFLELTKGRNGFLWFLFMAMAVLFMYLLNLWMRRQSCAGCGISLYPRLCNGGVCSVSGVAAAVLFLLLLRLSGDVADAFAANRDLWLCVSDFMETEQTGSIQRG